MLFCRYSIPFRTPKINGMSQMWFITAFILHFYFANGGHLEFFVAPSNIPFIPEQSVRWCNKSDNDSARIPEKQ